jgi:hypothetical protein
MVWNAHRAWAEVMRIFTQVRGIGILGSWISTLRNSSKFAFKEFCELRLLGILGSSA